MTNTEFDFEENYRKLEDIVKKLESGQLGLQESIELYENGMKLSKQCSDFLDAAQQKIEYISNTEAVFEKNDEKNIQNMEI